MKILSCRILCMELFNFNKSSNIFFLYLYVYMSKEKYERVYNK